MVRAILATFTWVFAISGLLPLSEANAQPPSPRTSPNLNTYAAPTNLRATDPAEGYSPEYPQPRSNRSLHPRARMPAPYHASMQQSGIGYGFQVPRYRWGWFGATHYYPYSSSHTGYYGNRSSWSYRSGY